MSARRLAAAVVVAVVVALAAAPASAQRLGFDPASVYRVPLGDAPSDGPADAPVTIVEWSDHTCGFCVRVQPTLDALRRLYPGQLRFVHRTLPLSDDHTLAAEAVLAAEAQGRGRAMSERLYALVGKIDAAAVEGIARALGLDVAQLRRELAAGTHRARIAADARDAAALGVTGTPAFFINGRALLGNRSLRQFAAVVDEELARSAAAGAGADHAALVARGAPTADTVMPAQDDAELDPAQVYRVGLGLPGHRSGPDDARVTIVVWGDFQCPFCARMLKVLDHVRSKYGDQVRIAYRHLALRMHRSAPLAAEAAVAAAAQGKFWAFHDVVFGNFGRLARSDLETFAELADLDLAKFREALDTRRYRELVAAETASALALGIDASPTIFVDGVPVVGMQEIAAVDALIDRQLARARIAVQGGIAPSDLYAVAMSGAAGEERADPASIPQLSTLRVAMRGEQRAWSVAAACRRRDATVARGLATGLTAAPRRLAATACAAVGIDLR